MNLPNKKEALADFKFRLKNLKREKKAIEKDDLQRWQDPDKFRADEYKVELYSLFGEMTATYHIMGWKMKESYMDNLVMEMQLDPNIF